MEKPTKLTIEHLAAHLPHEVDFVVQGLGKPERHTLTQMNLKILLEHIRVFDNAKLMLKPLSSINQREMVEILAEAMGWEYASALHTSEGVEVFIRGDDYKFDPERSEGDEIEYIRDYMDKLEEADGESVLVCDVPFHMGKNLRWGTQDIQYFVDMKTHLAVLRELCKRHYDIYGLIEADLAIDMYSIEG